MEPEIRKSGRHWIIYRGPNKASPCCATKEEAEQLLQLSKRERTVVSFILDDVRVQGNVTNCGLLHEKGELIEMLAVRISKGAYKETYWVPASECEEV